MNKAQIEIELEKERKHLRELIERAKKKFPINTRVREEISETKHKIESLTEKLKTVAQVAVFAMLAAGPILAFAEEKSDSIIQEGDVRTLFETITSLPKLGTWGIVLFLVAVVVAIGVWWWWNSYTKKITKRENDQRRARDQASNRTENQDVSDEWNEATERVEDAREGVGSDDGKKPRTDPPDGE